ncbi:hypothetical protein RB619_14845 [Flavobacterium sp. LHD-80]|uniref:hypothetical protein n=1 Tax=Flavobacterium sp. LHD-80 TaxID=3071411 RepID=UPI0027DEBA8E|nr:hypothetical protein [Flavobacterium sp. LHD-80]MDQ6471928.1 hypothetical protein [Flavobacterium sp. LHD-80]
MAAKKPEEMTNEELLKNEVLFKTIIYLLLFFAILLLALGIWLTIVKKQFSALTVIPLSLGIIVMVNANTLKTLQKEKKSRGL